MASKDFGYGSYADYPEELVKPGVQNPEEYYLYLWEPTNPQVTGAVDYTAVWHHALNDTWDEILASGEDGTFTIAVRDGIITGLTEDDPPEPEEPVEPDPQEPDPQEPDPNEEGE